MTYNLQIAKFIQSSLGCSQVVRQEPLKLPFGGSNPSTPANLFNRNSMDRFKRSVVLAVITLMITPMSAYAGGPALSRAFLLCNTLSTEADYSPESVNTLSKDLGFPFYIYAFHIETAGKGQRAYATFIDRDLSAKGLMEEITSKCKEYTPSIDALLQNEISDWVKTNDDIYTQGSIFIFTPYSKQSE